jgi:hypothetical protein
MSEETTIQEVERRIIDGSFYDDYDWASGPALRAIRRCVEALEGIAGEAFVSLDDWPLGWRDVATQRIDLARSALEGAE